MPVAPLLSVRISAGERDLLETAAAQARTKLSDFVRRNALDAAEIAVAQHPIVTIGATDWDRFEAWAQSPGKTVPALQQLARTRPAWD